VCGQKGVSLKVGMHDFVHDAMHELSHVDGKVLLTLRLLVTKPGQLTKEFLAGRRARYISPVRLYLTCSLLFFTLAAILPGAMKDLVKVGPTKNGTVSGLHADTAFKRELERGLRRAPQESEKLRAAIMHNLPRAMFVLMPVFALLIWPFYRRQQPYYIPHLYYAIHIHAFAFLVWSIDLILARAGVPRPLAAVTLLANIPYHYIALRRVYGGTRAMTFVKGTVIGFVYWLLVLVTVMSIAVYAMMHL
jgi:hypothetical protein